MLLESKHINGVLVGIGIATFDIKEAFFSR